MGWYGVMLGVTVATGRIVVICYTFILRDSRAQVLTEGTKKYIRYQTHIGIKRQQI